MPPPNETEDSQNPKKKAGVVMSKKEKAKTIQIESEFTNAMVNIRNDVLADPEKAQQAFQAWTGALYNLVGEASNVNNKEDLHTYAEHAMEASLAILAVINSLPSPEKENQYIIGTTILSKIQNELLFGLLKGTPHFHTATKSCAHIEEFVPILKLIYLPETE